MYFSAIRFCATIMILSRRWHYRVHKGLSTCPLPQGPSLVPFSRIHWFLISLLIRVLLNCSLCSHLPQTLTFHQLTLQGKKKPDCLNLARCVIWGHQSLSTLMRLQLMRSVWPWVVLLFTRISEIVMKPSCFLWHPKAPKQPSRSLNFVSTVVWVEV